MSTLLVFSLLISIKGISHSETITCSHADCSCNNKNEICDLQCLGYQQCYPSSGMSAELDCNSGYECNVDCDGAGSTGYACRKVIVNSNGATHLTVNCNDYRDCLYATVNCGDSLYCDVVCNGYYYGYNCDTLTLNCGTSQCSITCPDVSCSDIVVQSSNAQSFQCIGDSPTSCGNAPAPFKSPTSNPSKSPSTTNPTLSPTPSPTTFPTNIPTPSPTNVPTSSPTNIPTPSPSNIPINTPTPSTTVNPTPSPTNNPTTSPTNNPTNKPTDDPTASPTNRPTSAPTHNPTALPTTNQPTTAEPTNRPSSKPVYEPTISIPAPTTIYTTLETIFINGSTVTPITSSIASTETTKQNDLYFQQIHIMLMCLLLTVIISSYIDAHYIRYNDFYVVGALIVGSIQILDMVSDIFFSLHVNVTIMSIIDLQTLKSSLSVILLISIVSILFPAMMSLMQLHIEIKKWRGNDLLNQWIRDNIKFLFIISAICGSAFTGIQLSYCNAFGFRIFDIPLSKPQLTSFQTKRVYSAVLLENIPQLIVQIWFVILSGNNTNVIVYSSIIFSILSIITSIMAMATQQRIMKETHYVSVQLDIKGKVIIMNAHKYRNCIKSIHKQIASLFGLDYNLLQILRPSPTQNGLHIHINIFINNVEAIDRNIKGVMENAKNTGLLAEIFRTGWDINAVGMNVKFTNLCYKIHESQVRRNNTVHIKAMSQTIGDHQFDYIALTENVNKDKEEGIISQYLKQDDDISSDSEECLTKTNDVTTDGNALSDGE